jgi:hypothetical protein
LNRLNVIRISTESNRECEMKLAIKNANDCLLD